MVRGGSEPPHSPPLPPPPPAAGAPPADELTDGRTALAERDTRLPLEPEARPACRSERARKVREGGRCMEMHGGSFEELARAMQVKRVSWVRVG